MHCSIAALATGPHDAGPEIDTVADGEFNPGFRVRVTRWSSSQPRVWYINVLINSLDGAPGVAQWYQIRCEMGAPPAGAVGFLPRP